ncbi:unnamed protein product [Cochlearia groenlandica]
MPITSSFLGWVENNMNPVQPLPLMEPTQENLGEVLLHNDDERQWSAHLSYDIEETLMEDYTDKILLTECKTTID